MSEKQNEEFIQNLKSYIFNLRSISSILQVQQVQEQDIDNIKNKIYGCSHFLKLIKANVISGLEGIQSIVQEQEVLMEELKVSCDSSIEVFRIQYHQSLEQKLQLFLKQLDDHQSQYSTNKKYISQNAAANRRYSQRPMEEYIYSSLENLPEQEKANVSLTHSVGHFPYQAKEKQENFNDMKQLIRNSRKIGNQKQGEGTYDQFYPITHSQEKQNAKEEEEQQDEQTQQRQTENSQHKQSEDVEGGSQEQYRYSQKKQPQIQTDLLNFDSIKSVQDSYKQNDQFSDLQSQNNFNGSRQYYTPRYDQNITQSLNSNGNQFAENEYSSQKIVASTHNDNQSANQQQYQFYKESNFQDYLQKLKEKQVQPSVYDSYEYVNAQNNQTIYTSNDYQTFKSYQQNQEFKPEKGFSQYYQEKSSNLNGQEDQQYFTYSANNNDQDDLQQTGMTSPYHNLYSVRQSIQKSPNRMKYMNSSVQQQDLTGNKQIQLTTNSKAQLEQSESDIYKSINQATFYDKSLYQTPQIENRDMGVAEFTENTGISKNYNKDNIETFDNIQLLSPDAEQIQYYQQKGTARYQYGDDLSKDTIWFKKKRQVKSNISSPDIKQKKMEKQQSEEINKELTQQEEDHEANVLLNKNQNEQEQEDGEYENQERDGEEQEEQEEDVEICEQENDEGELVELKVEVDQRDKKQSYLSLHSPVDKESEIEVYIQTPKDGHYQPKGFSSYEFEQGASVQEEKELLCNEKLIQDSQQAQQISWESQEQQNIQQETIIKEESLKHHGQRIQCLSKEQVANESHSVRNTILLGSTTIVLGLLVWKNKDSFQKWVNSIIRS